VVDGRAEPQPVHPLIHAWGNLTYDPDRRAFAFFAPTGIGTYFLAGWDDGAGPMAAGIRALEAMAAGREQPVMSPWFYDVGAARFARRSASAPSDWDPDYTHAADYPRFFYLPTQHRYVLAGRMGVYYFDAATTAWTRASDEGPRPTGYDSGGCYDGMRGVIYLGGGSDESRAGFYTYDPAGDDWSAPTTSGPASMGTNVAAVHYDAANDVVVVLHHEDEVVYGWSPATGAWSARPFPSEVSAGSRSVSGYYDAALNVHVLHFALDGSPDGELWVYRWGP
jgi:hypothetical protein